MYTHPYTHTYLLMREGGTKTRGCRGPIQAYSGMAGFSGLLARYEDADRCFSVFLPAARGGKEKEKKRLVSVFAGF